VTPSFIDMTLSFQDLVEYRHQALKRFDELCLLGKVSLIWLMALPFQDLVEYRHQALQRKSIDTKH